MRVVFCSSQVFVYVLMVVLCVVSLATCTLGPNDKKVRQKKKVKENKAANEPVQAAARAEPVLPVLDGAKELNPSDIIKQHDKYCASCALVKAFPNKVLGYVTPWNRRGYELSVTFANKFSSLSPVWFQVKRVGARKFELIGEHNVVGEWMQHVRDSVASGAAAGGQPVLFLPRIMFEQLKLDDLHALFNDEAEMQALANFLAAKADKHRCNGFVLEVYIQLRGQASKHDLVHLVSDIANALHAFNKQLVLVIPPPVMTVEEYKAPTQEAQPPLFDLEDFEALKDVVDGFSLMTYDYSVVNRVIGPNAPLAWVQANVAFFTDEYPDYASKVFMGLNFYGMRYEVDATGKTTKAPEPIVGHQLVDFLKKNRDVRIVHDEGAEEHIFFLKARTSQTIICFPTQLSIQKKLDLAVKMGVPIAIWELGQGLDYFFDLL